MTRTGTRRRTVFEVHEVPDMAALRQWARDHRAQVCHLGQTWEDAEPCEVYGARRGPQLRVCRVREDRPHSILWESPLEHLPT